MPSLLRSTLVFTAALLLAGCREDRPATEPADETTESGRSARGAPRIERGVCVLQPIGDGGVRGTLYFDQRPDGLRVTGAVRGLEPGKHGFHIHQYGDLTDRQEGQSAGGHYAPRGMPHGRPADHERHVGDFGNITANEDGVATIDFTDHVARLGGEHAIVGRAIVVHAGEDQFTQPSGDAGARVAFGVIGIAKGESETTE